MAEARLGAPRIVTGPRTGFRKRARLAVRGRAGAPKIGIFREGTHHVVDIPSCLVHDTRVSAVMAGLRRALVATRAAPYSDVAHAGLVRYAQIVIERTSGTAQVVVVMNEPEPTDASRAILGRLQVELGSSLHSLFWNGNPERSNTILGPAFVRLFGPDATRETIGGAAVFFPPGAFGQSHLDLADTLVETVHAWIPDGARVLELYAGVGAIGLGLVQRSAEVTFNELSRDSLRGLSLGLGALPEAVGRRAHVVPGSAADAAPRVATADAVIVDPPRRGLDAPLRAALLATPVPTLVYVACGLASFLSDAHDLLASGRYHLRDLVVFDLFPYTEHVEVAARLERAP
jgi:tRNA/tmRNA/rRNA uracil-C5-methylase (TrmA/RlmC/RlmD family)